MRSCSEEEQGQCGGMWASLWQPAGFEALIIAGAITVLDLEGSCYLAVRICEEPTHMLRFMFGGIEMSVLLIGTKELCH